MRRRLVAAGLLLVAVAAGLGVHLLLADSVSSDIAGDVLYALAIYVLVVIVVPRWRPLSAGAVALAWCAAVELFQLTDVPMQAGAVFPPAMLVFGTVFDPRDLLVYTVAVTAVVAVDDTIRRAGRARSPQATR